MSLDLTLPCDICDAPCASVCAPHHASGHPGTAPGAMMRLAQGGPHALLGSCTNCGACEGRCPHGVAVRAGIRPTLTLAHHERLLARWRQETPWRTRTLLWAGCSSHGVQLDAANLARALLHHGVQDVIVCAALRCGGDTTQPDAALASLIGGLHVGVREIVVPTGACRAAMAALLSASGLRGRTVAVLDQWLARFGVSVPPKSRRFACCRLRRDARDADGASSDVWPPGPTCCGAGEPLRSAAPDVSDATAAALFERWREAGLRRVHVEDASCAAHLRAVGRQHGHDIHIVTRLDAFLAAADL